MDSEERVRFELATFFHWLTVACLLLGWIGPLMSGTPVATVCTIYCAIAVLLGVVVGYRWKSRPVQRLLISFLFMVGGILVAVYIAVFVIAVLPRTTAERHGISVEDQLLAELPAFLFFLPAGVLLMGLYRAWVWAAYDARYGNRSIF